MAIVTLSSLIFIISIGIFVGAVFKAVKHGADNSRSSNAQHKNNNNKRYSSINSHYSKQTLKNNIDIMNDVKRVTSNVVKIDKEPAPSFIRDEKNDWLSQQMEEERKAYKRVSRVFEYDMAKEHSKHCDANGIDTGRGK